MTTIRRGLAILLVVLLASTTLAAFSTAAPAFPVRGKPVTVVPTVQSTGPAPVSGPVSEVVSANNRFGTELYGVLARDPSTKDENLFFSPFSISSALAITYEGAAGKTASEILEVFHFPADNATRQSGYKALISGINAKDKEFELKTANALWVEKTFRLLPAFTRVAETTYFAKATNLDFVKKSENSRKTINSWVESQTNKRIKDLLPQGSVNGATRLVITNAVFFHGAWVSPFDPAMTKQEPFRTLDGTTVTAKMMKQSGSESRYPYGETKAFQAVSLPYAHSGKKQLSMVVVLPHEDQFQSFEKSFDEKTLEDVKASLVNQRVDVSLPKFKMETRYGLVPVLASMGMPSAFDPGTADFSGIDGKWDLVITEVVHKAFVEVNEEGTEAAAATGVVIALTSVMDPPPVPVFRADHPFLFFIQDDETGAVLFMGRVADPS